MPFNAPTGAVWYIGIVSVHNPLWITQEVWEFTTGGLGALRAAQDQRHMGCLGATRDSPRRGSLAFAGAAAPTGYLLCDGTGFSTTTYAALFAAIAYAYGGSGGTFNVPDLRGRIPVGKGTNAAVDVLGENEGVAESLRRPQHRHSPHAHVVGGTNQVGGGQAQMPSNSNNQVWGSSSVDGGSGVATDPLNAPAYVVLNYIIKT